MKNLFDIKGFRATCVLSISRLINNIYLLRKRPKEKNMRRDYDDIIEYPMTYSVIIWNLFLYFLCHINWHHFNWKTSLEAQRCNCLGIPSYLLLNFYAKNDFTKIICVRLHYGSLVLFQVIYKNLHLTVGSDYWNYS